MVCISYYLFTILVVHNSNELTLIQQTLFIQLFSKQCGIFQCMYQGCRMLCYIYRASPQKLASNIIYRWQNKAHTEYDFNFFLLLSYLYHMNSPVDVLCEFVSCTSDWLIKFKCTCSEIFIKNVFNLLIES